MSEPLAVGTSIRSKLPVQVSREAGARGRARTGFYCGVSAFLLVIVLAGFSRTLYLRPFFDVPKVPGYLMAHGAVLTAWFGGLFVQAMLVSIRRIKVHRRLGWAMAGIGLAVAAISSYVTIELVPRQRQLGIDVNAGIDGFSEVVWTDLASLVVFLALLGAAVLLRRRVEWHRRFMVLASISIVSPALSSSRLGRLIPLLRGLGPLTPGSVRFAALLMFVAGVALYDVFTRKRFHPATLVGGGFLLAIRTVAGFWIAESDFGRNWVLGLQ